MIMTSFFSDQCFVRLLSGHNTTYTSKIDTVKRRMKNKGRNTTNVSRPNCPVCKPSYRSPVRLRACSFTQWLGTELPLHNESISHYTAAVMWPRLRTFGERLSVTGIPSNHKYPPLSHLEFFFQYVTFHGLFPNSVARYKNSCEIPLPSFNVKNIRSSFPEALEGNLKNRSHSSQLPFSTTIFPRSSCNTGCNYSNISRNHGGFLRISYRTFSIFFIMGYSNFYPL